MIEGLAIHEFIKAFNNYSNSATIKTTEENVFKIKKIINEVLNSKNYYFISPSLNEKIYLKHKDNPIERIFKTTSWPFREFMFELGVKHYSDKEEYFYSIRNPTGTRGELFHPKICFMQEISPQRKEIISYGLLQSFGSDEALEQFSIYRNTTPASSINAICRLSPDSGDQMVELYFTKKTEVAESKKKLKISYRTREGRVHEDWGKITYCGTVSEKNDVKNPIHNHVNWKHSWNVTGHWRKVSQLGRDREGKYCIKNYTWVKEHTRGDGPLIQSVRLFRSTNELSIANN